MSELKILAPLNIQYMSVTSFSISKYSPRLKLVAHAKVSCIVVTLERSHLDLHIKERKKVIFDEERKKKKKCKYIK